MRNSLTRLIVATTLTIGVLGSTAGTAFAGQNSSAVVSLGKLGRVELTSTSSTDR